MLSSQKYLGNKKKTTQEFESNNKVLQEFEQEFSDSTKRSGATTFIKAGVLDLQNKTMRDDERGDVYKLNVQQRQELNNSVVFRNLGSKNMDLILGKLKSKHQQNEKKKEVKKQESSQSTNTFTVEQAQTVFDDVLRQTPHCFVENDCRTIAITDITPRFTETLITQICQEFGAVESVQIRVIYLPDDIRAKIYGFVKFKTIESANKAIQILDNRLVQGTHLKVYKGGNVETESNQKQDIDDYELERIIIKLPLNYFLKKVIDKLAKVVATEGQVVEQYVKEKELDNNVMAFLYFNCPEQLYYKSKVFQIFQDKQQKQEPFQFTYGNQIYYPPSQTDEQELEKQFSSVFKKDKQKSNITIGSSVLPLNLRFQLEQILRDLTTYRSSIQNAMVFCMDNAKYSADIVLIITQSLISGGGPNQKLARLYLISDLLHNCQVTSGTASYWSYHMYFQFKLPIVFESFSSMQLPIGQLVEFQEKILRVVTVWSDWAVYEKKFLLGLRSTFQRKRTMFQLAELITPNGFLLKFYEEKFRESTKMEIEKACRQHGLVAQGNKETLINRLMRLKEFKLSEGLPEKYKQAAQEKQKLFQCLKDRLKKDSQLQQIDGEDLTYDDITKIKDKQVTVVSFYDISAIFKRKEKKDALEA